MNAVQVTAHGRTGPYKEKCSACCSTATTSSAAHVEEKKEGCADHVEDAHPLRTGDVCQSAGLKTTISFIQKQYAGENSVAVASPGAKRRRPKPALVDESAPKVGVDVEAQDGQGHVLSGRQSVTDLKVRLLL